MDFKEFWRLVRGDMKNYECSFLSGMIQIPGFKYTFHHRLCYYLSTHKLLFPFFMIERIYMKHITYLYGIQSAWYKPLPDNLKIIHYGGIFFFPKKCGKNVLIRQGVTIGNNGISEDAPEIGENVQFGANSMAIGNIKIGDNVMIGAGAVVTRDVPSDCVVAGVPAKIIRRLN